MKFDLKLARTLIPNEHLIELIDTLDPSSGGTIKVSVLELHNILGELLAHRAIRDKLDEQFQPLTK